MSTLYDSNSSNKLSWLAIFFFFRLSDDWVFYLLFTIHTRNEVIADKPDAKQTFVFVLAYTQERYLYI